ncbi:MAG TPA: hypothetical protein EYP04_09125, partial [Anaerolineae bacterium]|nr:hypothetical protein [Anaerolineae bacterium]
MDGSSGQADMLIEVANLDKGWKIPGRSIVFGRRANGSTDPRRLPPEGGTTNSSPSSWADLARDEAAAEADLIATLAAEQASLITAQANAQRDYDLAEAQAELTRSDDESTASSQYHSSIATAALTLTQSQSTAL